MSQLSRVTTWASNQILTAAALNGEFNNIVNAWNNIDTSSASWASLSVTGNMTVGGTFGVTGATTLSSTLGVTGAATLSSTLGVTGTTTLSSTLAVTSDATFSAHVGIGIAPFSTTNLHVRVAADENLEVRDNSGLALSALNNARGAFVPMTLETTALTIKNGTTVLSLKGTATNDNAAAGYMGEYPTIGQVTTPANMAASNTFANITTIALTAGDWDIIGSGLFLINGATLTSGFAVAVSTFTGNTTTDHVDGDNVMYASTSTLDKVSILVHYRLTLSGNTTIFLKSAVSYSGGGPPKAAGTIKARRVR